MSIAQTIELFQNDSITTLNGRVMTVKSFGKLSFFNIKDHTGEFQIGVHTKIDLPSRFDIIEVTGKLGTTKIGTKTLWAESIKIISKCLETPPVQNIGEQVGIADEKRFQNRTIDLMINPKSKEFLTCRAKVIRNIREYLWGKEFIEMDTPIFEYKPTESTAKLFKSNLSGGEEVYARIATEVNLKRLMIAGYDRVFEIGRIFRNEGIDATHNPEFTSVEFYQAYADLSDMKKHLLNIIQFNLGDVIEYDEIEYDDVVAKYGEDFDKNLIKPTFVYGQPAGNASFCKLRPDGKEDRFEFFAGGFEIANSFNEINDSVEQAKTLGEEHILVKDMRYGMPNAGGIGIGIERLAMYISGAKSIKDVIYMPL